ncbi:helix-turn-helix domain-containing protein [Teredinibacter sp. KSP-S5-2]|uniref:TetR/AcrR family transcriptional regulator n=1 Tax=Teredinibacter sp. KSP-S5-2 TaxID=3034506 RepID=UPI0029345397|nr:helix-turn-helix domain-containing protein [Teredinibacter sp. KSP-S5-2]WNO09034.1 helix-turn-helix domain containing protein [Teredinibacter sp. KSP-S5-2]
MKNKSQEYATEQAERILASAKKCFLRQGLRATTMRDIAAEADMSLGNIYRYFKNREVLVQAFIRRDNDEYQQALELLKGAKQIKKVLAGIAKEVIKQLSNRAELLIYTDILSEALLNNQVMELIALHETEEVLAGYLKDAEGEKRIRLSVPPDVAALSIISFMEYAATKCVFHKGYSVRKANKQFSQYLDLLIDE